MIQVTSFVSQRFGVISTAERIYMLKCASRLGVCREKVIRRK